MNTSTTNITKDITNIINKIDPTHKGVWVHSETSYYEVVLCGDLVFHVSTFNPITWEEDGNIYLSIGMIDERFPRTSDEDEVVMGDSYHFIVQRGYYEPID
jgi:hypothetical protein